MSPSAMGRKARGTQLVASSPRERRLESARAGRAHGEAGPRLTPDTR